MGTFCLNFYKKRYGDLELAKWMKNRNRKLKKLRKKIESPWGKAYSNARIRCLCPSVNKYEYYGGRGIKCLLKTADVKEAFIQAKAWKMKQPSLDRIDSSKNYTKENIRFIPMDLNRRRH